MTIQDINQILGLIGNCLTIIGLILGGAAGVFLFYQLAPVLSLRILPTWTDELHRHLLLRFEVENKSRVRVNRPKIRIQVLEQTLPSNGFLSQWVPFSEAAIKSHEQPVEWREPETIANTTQRIFPGETITIERLYHFPQDTFVLHAALQVEISLGVLARLMNRKTQNWRQTITRFIVKPSDS